MEEMIRISLLVVPTVMVAAFLQNTQKHLALLMTVALGILVLGYGFRKLCGIWEAFLLLQESLGTDGGYFRMLMKLAGITYLCEFAAGICKDAGYGFLAVQTETLGKITVMLSGISVMLAVIEQIKLLV